ncbi:MAG: UDP-N-acetylmuramoyl-L-alanine--D-glutamate ligase [Chloroflexota bacterium]
MADLSALSSLKVLVVGLGREGQALALYLARHGLDVTATDQKTAETLAAIIPSLEAAGIRLVLGEHPLSLLDEANLLFVSPGIPLEIPFLEEAKARNIPLCTETKLFCYLCPAPIVAVTGSSGKTTTVTLLSEIMKASGRKTWVGGNIGQPLIGFVDQIEPDDIVVMELSSFQLEYFHQALNAGAYIDDLPADNAQALTALLDNWSPKIGAILNITPNHLDRHPSMKQYVRAKRALINYQGVGGKVIMNLDNDMTRTIGKQFGPRTRWFSVEAQPVSGGCLLEDHIVLLDDESSPQLIATLDEIKLRGIHNVSNILAACLLAREAGAPLDAMCEVVRNFTGVEHRLELVRELKGVRYYNDSIATSPERLVAALKSFDEPVILLAGGRDKRLPWHEAARLILHKTEQVILFGEATDLIIQAVNKERKDIVYADTNIQTCATLEDAIQLAHQIAQPGQVVLLSPGCASFDMFPNYAERGSQFMALVRQLS